MRSIKKIDFCYTVKSVVRNTKHGGSDVEQVPERIQQGCNERNNFE